ncbi:MAG: peptide ABC transporter substrate-binding protein [Verrucomicrobiota bacterium]|nr:peptide ABC transporter substrate-binding protein [Verrucomicrobiota bacterium]
MHFHSGLARLFYSLVYCAVLLPVACLSLACSRQESRVVSGIRTGDLYLGNGVEPQSLDPQISTGVSELNIHFALFEGLVRPSAVDLSPLPGVADRWSVSDDGLVWTFYLRRDARWSNGDAVKAGDFIFAWRRILSPKLGARNASLLFVVKHAEDYQTGRLTEFAQVGFSAPDSFTLQIHLVKPLPYFLNLVMHPAWFPVHPGTIERFDAAEKRTSAWTRPGNHVGNGPFMLKEHRVNDRVVVEKNSYYHHAASVKLNRIHFYPMEDRNAEELAFLAGQLHATYSLPPGKAPIYREKKDTRLRLDPYLGTEYYLLNTKVKPLDDVRVRRALNLALNRELLVTRILGGGQQPAYGFVPPGTAGYKPQVQLAENLAEAQHLLAQAGFPDGQGFPPLELLYNTSEINRKTAEAVQETWRKNLGISILLTNQEYTVYLENRRLGNFQLCRSSWIGDYVDPDAFLCLWTASSGNNYSGWSATAYDAAVTAANATPEPTTRTQHFHDAEAILLNASPIVPLYHNVSAYLLMPCVNGWKSNLLGWPDYSAIELMHR